VVEQLRQKEELRKLNRPKTIQCIAASIFCLASAVMILSLNLSFHNTDYNTSVASAILWFLEVISLGSSIFLGFLGHYYSK